MDLVKWKNQPRITNPDQKKKFNRVQKGIQRSGSSNKINEIIKRNGRPLSRQDILRNESEIIETILLSIK